MCRNDVKVKEVIYFYLLNSKIFTFEFNYYLYESFPPQDCLFPTPTKFPPLIRPTQQRNPDLIALIATLLLFPPSTALVIMF